MKIDLLFLFFIIYIILFAKSTKGIKRLTKYERTLINIPNNIGEVLVGILLSDGHIARRSVTSNPRFIFSQSGKMDKRPYFYLVYNLFKLYCNKNYNYYIKTWIDKVSHQEYTSISFTTMQIPCFIEYHNTWYIEGKKIVPANIMELLTPIGLAHWIMGDGSRQNRGLHLSVYAFTLNEVQLLINVLKTKFGIKCSIHKLSSIGGKPRIYIWEESMIQLRSLVDDYIIPSMKYKIYK